MINININKRAICTLVCYVNVAVILIFFVYYRSQILGLPSVYLNESADDLDTVQSEPNKPSSALKTTTEEKKSTEKKKHTNNYCKNVAYDSKIKGMDALRLGFAISPSSQIKSKNGQELLEDIRRRKNSSSVDAIGEMKPKKILVLDYAQWAYHLQCLKKPISEIKCEYDYWFSMNLPTSSLSEVARDFDAITVYRSSLLKSDLQAQLDFINENPKRSNDRPVNVTKIIYITLESPAPPHDWQMDFRSSRIVNGKRQRSYFASYWRGSDVYIPYAIWDYYDPNVTSKIQNRNYAAGRTQMAAIVVSNCLPNNNRLGFVKELKKYIQVDVFGKCGDYECRQVNCMEKIRQNYKFYLAFENSNCRDYITEKLYLQAMENDLLPIVLGAHPLDYKVIMPQNSYIHVEDFDSIQSLADYINLLHRNDTLYNQYFTWKWTGEFHTSGLHINCGICYFLHAQDLEDADESIGRNDLHDQEIFMRR